MLFWDILDKKFHSLKIIKIRKKYCDLNFTRDGVWNLMGYFFIWKYKYFLSFINIDEVDVNSIWELNMKMKYLIVGKFRYFQILIRIQNKNWNLQSKFFMNEVILFLQHLKIEWHKKENKIYPFSSKLKSNSSMVKNIQCFFLKS